MTIQKRRFFIDFWVWNFPTLIFYSSVNCCSKDFKHLTSSYIYSILFQNTFKCRLSTNIDRVMVKKHCIFCHISYLMNFKKNWSFLPLQKSIAQSILVQWIPNILHYLTYLHINEKTTLNIILAPKLTELWLKNWFLNYLFLV